MIHDYIDTICQNHHRSFVYIYHIVSYNTYSLGGPHTETVLENHGLVPRKVAIGTTRSAILLDM